MLKSLLEGTNRLLHRYNHSSTPSLWAFWHKWNYEHTFVKNILAFSNKILKEINRYHIFKWSWMIGFVGAAIGLVVIQLEELYYQVKIGYEPMASQLVINAVLRNKAVSDKLSSVLDSNVFRNPDLQFYVHEALMNQVISPQKQTIKQLILRGVKLIHDKQTQQYLTKLAADNVGTLEEPIKTGALTFFVSPTMDRLVAHGLRSVLESLFLKQTIADQIKNAINSQLRNQDNSEALYQIIREKFI